MAIENVTGILDIIVTLFLGLVGYYLTYNFRRQVKQKTADSRMKSYAELWEITGVARPTRIKDWQAEDLQFYLVVVGAGSALSTLVLILIISKAIGLYYFLRRILQRPRLGL